MRKVFLYRSFESDNLQSELHAAQKAGFTLIDNRDDLHSEDIVLPRFYPFWNYLKDEFDQINVSIAAPYGQHDWLADIRQWYPVVKSFTPRTWLSIADVIEDDATGPFFVKGIDKSLKHDFNKFCYAENLVELPKTLAALQDALPVEQPLVIREFKKLSSYGNNPVGGAPLAHEFRVFVYDGYIVSQGFYWQSLIAKEGITNFSVTPPQDFLQDVIDLVGDKAKFYSLDVALTDEGEWIVIELNDGFLSGLCDVDQDSHYMNLFALLGK